MTNGNASPISTLILIPTAMERARLVTRLAAGADRTHVSLCGFGPVAAAARAAQQIAELRPERVLLVGIAGTYDQQELPIGNAAMFDAAAIDGVGAGEDDSFQPPHEMGFPQWPAGESSSCGPIEDRLPLACPAVVRPIGTLLTVCAASASDAMVQRRRAQHPEAVAEDMEGFAVAMACALSNVPLAVVRGISNLAGRRDTDNWQIGPALDAAAELAVRILASDQPWEMEK